MGKKNAINLKQLYAKKFTDVDFGRFTDIMGEVDGKCNVCIYGGSGGGKSVLAMQLAFELSRLYGKTLYNSHEEKHNKTLKLRAAGFLPELTQKDLTNFRIAEAWDFETMMKRIKTQKYRVIVIDSVQYMKLTIEQLTEMRETYARRNMMVIMVSFGTSIGKADAGNKLLHASDVKLHVHRGKLTSHGRGLSGWVERTLFVPVKSKKDLFTKGEDKK